LGGIRNLQITVLNDSKYVLDNVTVEVEYLKANKETFKTESVQFKSVAPNGTATIRMPDTNRGMKVVYKVVRVESKEFKNDMAGL
jgi:chloramphenicol O-acetyltransferase